MRYKAQSFPFGDRPLLFSNEITLWKDLVQEKKRGGAIKVIEVQDFPKGVSVHKNPITFLAPRPRLSKGGFGA
jgi:hypothetical protein